MVIAVEPTVYVVDLPGLPPLSLNDREHRMAHAKRVSEWREQAGFCAMAAGVPRVERAHIVLVAHPPNSSRRDVDNLAPTWKAAVDGCRDAGILVDDDATRVSMGIVIGEPNDRAWAWTLRIEPL